MTTNFGDGFERVLKALLVLAAIGLIAVIVGAGWLVTALLSALIF